MEVQLTRQFAFTSQEFDAVERLLSKERLSTYMVEAKGDREKAFYLYLYNRKLSSSLFECIGGLEVALRNSVHITLTSAFQSDRWYDSLPFSWLPYERRAIQRAKGQLYSRKKQITPGRIIAELTLGFWCGLTGKPYSTTLWIPHLYKAFPNKRLGRKDAYKRLNNIRELRNRIAHHECILHFDLQAEYANILDTVDWICPITSSWIEMQSSFPAILQSRPA
jgi:hypothetical protein